MEADLVATVALWGKAPYDVHPFTPEWRNWYTHQTQNLASVKDMSVRVRPPAPHLSAVNGRAQCFHHINLKHLYRLSLVPHDLVNEDG